MRVWWTILSIMRTRNIVIAIVIILMYYYISKERDPSMSEMIHLYKGEIFFPTSYKKKDWHNYTQIEYDKKRVGIGEHGKPASIPNNSHSYDLYLNNGYNAALGDLIALNRSLPDFRHKNCSKRWYLESLPSVSIIVPVYNEHWSTLLRTMISVFYRTPAELIKEFFLVDDGNTKEMYKEKLENYLKKNLPKVKLIRLPERIGLIKARLAGARKATGDVLVFLDSHVEANVNWLPPLLEPIALDYRTVMTPLIDVVDYHDFEYRLMDLGKRGAFNWKLGYMRLPLLPRDEKNMPEPFETPVMMGGLFAISRRFFWDLGGYDPGLEIWGGEQYELSFKVWQCGGRLLEAPCSRLGHLYRDFTPPTPSVSLINYIARNYIRVAEVWMDEYKEYLYMRRPYYHFIGPGDITEQKALRQRLNCKSFKWFMTQIAFDLIQQFPLIDPPPYAGGRIHPENSPEFCIDGNRGVDRDLVLLKPCYSPYITVLPSYNKQQFTFTMFNDIKLDSVYKCLDLLRLPKPGSFVRLMGCHRNGLNQQWRYYENTKQIVHYSSLCLDHNIEVEGIFLSNCDKNSKSQRWTIDVVNSEQLAKWDVSNNVRVTQPVEEWRD